jgi:hypothetical protein
MTVYWSPSALRGMLNFSLILPGKIALPYDERHRDREENYLQH